MPRKHSIAYNCQAFTLIELLIAISLSSIVMIVLVGGFFMVSRNWEAQEQSLDNEIDNSLIRLEIEKALLGSFPYTYMTSNKKKHIFFKGNDQSIQFVSTMSPAYDNQVMVWYIKVNREGGLLIQVANALTGDPSEIITKLNATKLTTNKPTLVFEDYKVVFEFLASNKKEAKYWVNKWDAEKKLSLPLAVAIHLKPIDDERDDLKSALILATIVANEHQNIRP